MSKKPGKVEETATPYVAKTSEKKAAAPKSATDGVKLADDAAFNRVVDKIFTERRELLRKLAQ